ncbi:hypothetical protein Tco_0968403 [Tanacetum coccineum]
MAEVIHEVFIKDNVVVNGMHRNLIPPVGVVGSLGLVIEESKAGTFVYNGSSTSLSERNLKGNMADVNVRNNKDVNLDNQNSNIDMVKDANETVSSMALKLPKVTSYFMRTGGSGKSSIYERWKKIYDGNLYDDNECKYLTPQQLWYKVS